MKRELNEYQGNTGDYKDFNALVGQAFAKAEKILNSQEINLGQFSGFYEPKKIQADQKKVESLEKAYQAEDNLEHATHRKVGKILEALFFDQVRNNFFMGKNTVIKKASKFDDYINGVDFITEHIDQGKSFHLALAIDATSGSAYSKFPKIGQDVKAGKNLTEAKYIKVGARAGLPNIPRVMIGMNSEKALAEIIQLWVSGDNEKLNKHPAQTYFLEQIYAQLQGIATYYLGKEASKNPESSKLAEIYGRLAKIIAPILEEKRVQAPLGEITQQDNTLKIIQDQLGLLNKPRAIAA